MISNSKNHSSFNYIFKSLNGSKFNFVKKIEDIVYTLAQRDGIKNKLRE